ncbi:Fur family transcriptional regulator [Kineosporia succinea]|uniref:Fur family ferric uptake transcriptional regulator n=1 Tax=Kineosporia succinea TaxID=84632 RepID=A0ABT9P2T3_9ACTN|nr:Fur family transcriptional regulator [Kineosporia succinea]MDP9826992.1 Fur family ferric uptake transcriptional regulator [Kineosporia succinea]
MTTEALDAALRERGLRATPQRRSVLRAVAELGHATPEEVCDFVETEAGQAGSGESVNLSTVYRSLELMEKIGVVSHTHLTHGSPTYQVADHVNHLHLVCRGCGRIDEADLDLAVPFAEAVRAATGFETDLAHLSLHGTCADCRGVARPAGHGHGHPHD